MADLTESGDSVDAEPSAEAALARRLPELNALSAKDVVQLNRDPSSVVAIVLGALPRLRTFHAQLESTFTRFRAGLFDELEDWALILHYAHGAYLATTTPKRCPPALAREAREMRTTLICFLTTCAQRKLVDRSAWKLLRGTRGFKNIATDLSLLASVFRSHPHLIAGQTMVTQRDIQRSTELSAELLAAANKRRAPPEQIAAAADLRARAFTMVLRAYDEARCAILYLRKAAGDADDIAPSLYGGREARRERESVSKSSASPMDSAASAPSALDVHETDAAATTATVATTAAATDKPNKSDPFLN